jgi:hypothetical protein
MVAKFWIWCQKWLKLFLMPFPILKFLEPPLSIINSFLQSYRCCCCQYWSLLKFYFYAGSLALAFCFHLYTTLYLIYTCVYKKLRREKADIPYTDWIFFFIILLFIIYCKNKQQLLFVRNRQLGLQGGPKTPWLLLCPHVILLLSKLSSFGDGRCPFFDPGGIVTSSWIAQWIWRKKWISSSF